MEETKTVGHNRECRVCRWTSVSVMAAVSTYFGRLAMTRPQYRAAYLACSVGSGLFAICTAIVPSQKHSTEQK